MTNIPSRLSRRISVFRCVGTFGIMLLHYFQAYDYHKFEIEGLAYLIPYVSDLHLSVRLFKGFMMSGICAGGVTVFFLVSGYLQFSREQDYATVLRKRVRNLLVPYFLWYGIAIATYLVSRDFTGASKLFEFCRTADPKQWFIGLVGNYEKAWKGGSHCTAMYHFWFLRDLFVLALLTPLFDRVLRRRRLSYVVVGVAAILYACKLRPVIVGADALVFYLLGGIFAKGKTDFFELIDRHWHWWCCAAFLVFSTVLMTLPCSRFSAPHIVRISSALLLMKITVLLERNDAISRCSIDLGKRTFFYFCVHGNYLYSILIVAVFSVIPVEKSPWLQILGYMLLMLLGLAVCVIIETAVRRWLPRCYALLTGGRI